jgi:branched-chain amino acid transport system permease protein
MYWLLVRSDWGRRVAAVSFDRDTAQLLGVHVRRTVVGVYLVTGVLTACAGLLVGPMAPVQSHMGMLYLLKAFAVISIGGFTNPLGLLVGGLAFGCAESFSNYWNSEYGDLFPFLGVAVFLVFRPMGLFSERRADVR